MTKLDCLLKSTVEDKSSSSCSTMSSDASQISSATFSHSLLTSKLLLDSLNLLKSKDAFNFLPIKAAAAAFLSAATASTSSFLIFSIISSWNWTSIKPKFFRKLWWLPSWVYVGQSSMQLYPQLRLQLSLKPRMKDLFSCLTPLQQQMATADMRLEFCQQLHKKRFL